MSYYDEHELAAEDALSPDLVDLLRTAERFHSRPRRPPVDEAEPAEPIDWEARDDPAEEEE
ncbi:MAG TPA: hypothetical protein VGU73_08050 [Acidimicrobiia bacterium]|nr:hypothetical protein [Acidimicrobiia bacterium]